MRIGCVESQFQLAEGATAAAVAVVLVGAIAIARVAPAAEASTPAAGARPVLVATSLLEAAALDLTLPPKSGLLLAGEHRLLAFEVAGRLCEIAEPADSFQSDAVIARLDDALERAAVEQAKLRLAEAQRDLDRLRGLRQSRATSVKSLDAAQTALSLRRADLDVARERLARRVLRAPFAGVVGETRYEVGEVVRPGDPALSLLDLSTLRMELGIPGSQIDSVRTGARVVVDVSGSQRASLVGVVERVAPAPAEGRHLFAVEVRIPNQQGTQRAGMGASARIVTRSLESALRVPLELVVERGGERVVFFADGGVAIQIPVADAPLDGDTLLLPGELPQRELIVRGQRDLQEGARVRVDNTVLGRLDRGR